MKKFCINNMNLTDNSFFPQRKAVIIYLSYVNKDVNTRKLPVKTPVKRFQLRVFVQNS